MPKNALLPKQNGTKARMPCNLQRAPQSTFGETTDYQLMFVFAEVLQHHLVTVGTKLYTPKSDYQEATGTEWLVLG